MQAIPCLGSTQRKNQERKSKIRGPPELTRHLGGGRGWRQFLRRHVASPPVVEGIGKKPQGTKGETQSREAGGVMPRLQSGQALRGSDEGECGGTNEIPKDGESQSRKNQHPAREKPEPENFPEKH